MRFSYISKVDGAPPSARRPMFRLKVIGTGGFVVLDALADTGTTSTYIEYAVASSIGVDLVEVPNSVKWRGVSFHRYRGDVELEVEDDDGVVARWKASVYFWRAGPGYALFGQKAGLLNFDVEFCPTDKQMIWTPNRNFHATGRMIDL